MSKTKPVIVLLLIACVGGLIWYLARADVLTQAQTLPAPASTTTTASRRALAPRNDLPGLTNFAQVSPNLYRGAQPTAEGFGALKKMGIKTVVSLRTLHSDRDLLQGTGLRYAHFQCKAWHPEEEDVVKFLKLMQDPANHPVFVHCQQGSDRTGMMVTVYRITTEGWTPDAAMAELPNFGFHPIWTEIKEYLSQVDAAALKKKVEAAKMPGIETIN